MGNRVVSLLLFLAMMSGPSFAQDLDRGQELFRSVCGACHSLTPGRHRTGPSLAGVWMRPIGGVGDFRYSKAFTKRAKSRDVWDAAALDAFLKKPRKYIKRTRMQFKGFKDPADRAAVIEYLKVNSS